MQSPSEHQAGLAGTMGNVRANEAPKAASLFHAHDLQAALRSNVPKCWRVHLQGVAQLCTGAFVPDEAGVAVVPVHLCPEGLPVAPAACARTNTSGALGVAGCTERALPHLKILPPQPASQPVRSDLLLLSHHDGGLHTRTKSNTLSLG